MQIVLVLRDKVLLKGRIMQVCVRVSVCVCVCARACARVCE